MANIKSSKKRILITERQTKENKRIRTNVGTVIKNANLAIEEDAADVQEKVNKAIKRIDQAASRGIIHKNNAARKKSSLVKKANKKA